MADVMSLGRRRLGATALVVAAVALFLGACGGGAGRPEPSATGAAPTPEASPSPVVEASPTATPGPPVITRPLGAPVPGESAADRIVVSKAKVNAPITLRVVPANGGQLASPIGPDDVVFYDFSAFPGLGGFPGAGGRVVMSGHVDSGRVACKNGTQPPPCTAVFWDIDQLKPGDEIEIVVAGASHRYRVTHTEDVRADDQEKWDALWVSTPTETIALITCGGDFNRATLSYSHRHVVTGERI